MSYKEYTVRVYGNGDKHWFLNGQLHREDGPAVENVSGHKAWYLNGKNYTEAEFNVFTNKTNCEGKCVEIEGVKYKLTAV